MKLPPLAGLLVALALLCAGPAVAQQAGASDLRESQRRLEEVRRERERLRSEMERARGRVHELSSEVGNLERQVGASAVVLDELGYQLTEREAQIEQNRRDLEDTRAVLEERGAMLRRRLRDIYKRGPLHTADVLLSAESFSELLSRYRYLLMIARHDRLLVAEVKGLEAQLGARERALRSSLLELATVRDARSEEHGALASLERERQRALEGARTTERTTARRMEALAEDERRIATMVATLESRRAAESRAAGPGSVEPPATLSAGDLGTLPWPAQGSVLYRFGRAAQRDGTLLRRIGVGIAAPPGTPVRAVEAGTVVMAGAFEGYERTVVLSHGGGYYSLYLYLRDVSVGEGDRVARGAPVGTVGGAATPEGPHLELQIRAPGGQAVDPLPWLQPRSR